MKICIDSVTKHGTKAEYTLRGWRLNPENPSVPSMTVAETTDYTVTNEYRPDVNALYHLSADVLCGFSLTVSTSGTETLTVAIHDFENGQERLEEVTVSLANPAITPGTETSLQRKVLRLRKGLSFLKQNGVKATVAKLQHKQKNSNDNYLRWIRENEVYETQKVTAEIKNFAYQPLISIAMPVYNVDDIWLSKCIASVENQSYQNWELCIADDKSTKASVKPLLEKYQQKDARIKVVFRPENGHICKATNSALEIATGEFVALLDNDDELAPNALYEVVKKLNQNPDYDLIYSDENKLSPEGVRMDPTFKPDWSPDLLMSTNYICHLGVYRRSLINEIGGFRPGYEGAQDYDLVLRFSEKTSRDKICHIPKVLYHWRMLETSTAVNQDSKGYAFEAGRLAVEDALKRRGQKGSVTHAAGNGLYDVHYTIEKPEKVSIIIPTRDGYEDTKRCVDSILAKTTYENYEIIMADNGSTDERMPELYANYQKQVGEKFKPISLPIPFNYSRINNLAAKEASGTYLLFLNNDTEVIAPNWLTEMVSFGQLERIGCVGAKLYYPNNTIQHAGVILGMGGVAGHGHHTFPRGDFGYFGRLEINVNYSAVTAACLLMKKADFDAIGGFDEELTVAYNDVDLCLRTKALGRDNVWLHAAELYHYESQTRGYDISPEKRARLDKEANYLLEKYPDQIQNDPYYNPNLTKVAGDFSINMEKVTG